MTPDSKAPRDPFDLEFARGIVEKVIGPIADHYFRVELIGAHRIPDRGPVILAANHSGNAFPHDAIHLDIELWRRDELDPAKKFRTVYEPELSAVWWMRPFGLDNFWRRGGGVDMTFDNLQRLLERGDRVLYFPEGVPGIGKGFNRRYQLQEFKTSFMLLAARQGVPVLPLYVINGEWIHPFGYTFRPLDRLMQRVFQVPFLPLPLGLAAIVLPWIWYLAFPARLVFVVGEPIDVQAALRQEGVTEYERPERDRLRRAAKRVRQLMQRELDGLVAIHGREPYRPAELLRSLRNARGGLGRILPWGWPLSFLRHERDRRRAPARNRLHRILRDWDLLGFYLPFGWPLISLARAFRRPPYGYRGVDRERRRELQGSYLWRLTDRPLPARGSAPIVAPVSGIASRRGVDEARGGLRVG